VPDGARRKLYLEALDFMAALEKHIAAIELELARMTRDGHFAEPEIDMMMRRLDLWLRQIQEINRKRLNTLG
jgi:hypothetical protein